MNSAHCFAGTSFLFLCLFFNCPGYSAEITVSSSADSGPGSLRQAVLDAQSGDIVLFASALSVITLTSGNITIDKALIIQGPGSGSLHISGGGEDQIFHVSTLNTVTIANITLKNARGGQEYYSSGGSDYYGGAALLADAGGTVHVYDCEFVDNSSSEASGSSEYDYGGAVLLAGSGNAILERCLFSGNSVFGSQAVGGGAVSLIGGVDVTIKNCTFFDNSSPEAGGAIRCLALSSSAAPELTLTNCTFYNNSASALLAATDLYTSGPDNEVFLQNCIFDRSSSSLLPTIQFVGLGTFISRGGNIFRDTPISLSTLLSDIINGGYGAAGLETSLALNGGTVRSLAISSSSSAAINHGTTGYDEPGNDGRRYLRVGNPDAGAFEFDAPFSYKQLRPEIGATSADVSADLQIEFYEKVTVGTGAVRIWHSSNNSLVLSITGAQISGAGTRILSFSPGQNIPAETGLYITVEPDVVQTEVGTSFAGIEVAGAWSFTTGEVPNSAPTISADLAEISLRSNTTAIICLSIDDAETTTTNLQVQAVSSEPGIIAAGGIKQIGATSATTCFQVSSAQIQTFGNVTITFSVEDGGGERATSSVSVTVLPVIPDRVALSTTSSAGSDGFNSAGGAGNAVIQIGANPARSAAPIQLSMGAFNNFDQLSPTAQDIPIEFQLLPITAETELQLSAGGVNAVFPAGISVSTADIIISYSGAFQTQQTLQISTTAQSTVAINSTSISLRILPPPALQIGLSTAPGNSAGAAGAGIGLDGFNAGESELHAHTTVNITLSSFDAVNNLAAIGNDVFPLQNISTSVAISVDDPRVQLPGVNNLTLSNSVASSSAQVQFEYKGFSTLQTTVHFVNSGALGSTSVSVQFVPQMPFLIASLAALTIQEDAATQFSLQVGDVQSGPAALRLSVTSDNPSVIPTNNIIQLDFPTSATTRFEVRGAPDANGSATLTITASDAQGNQSSTTLIVNITDVNDPPIVLLPQTLDVPGNQATTLVLDISDAEESVTQLSISATSANQSLINDADLIISIVDGLPVLTIQPQCYVSGSVEITVTVEDNDTPPSRTSTTISVQIEPSSGLEISATEHPCPGTPNLYSIPQQSGATIQWEVCNGIIVDGQGSNQLWVNWPAATSGKVDVVVTNSLDCEISSSVNVSAANIQAVIDMVDSPASGSSFNVLDNDIGTGLVLVDAQAPRAGTLSTNANGLIQYQADPDFTGTDFFTYRTRSLGGCIVSGAAVVFRSSSSAALTNLSYLSRKRNNSDGVVEMRNPVGLCAAPDGNSVYVSSKLDNSILHFKRSATNGSLQYQGHVQHQINGVKSLVSPFDLVVDPTGRHVYAASFGSDAVLVFERESTTHSLRYLERKVNGKFDGCTKITGLSTAIGLAMSPDGTSLYATGYSANSLAAFRRDPQSGRLQFLERHKDGKDGVNGLRLALGVAVSPDGRNVYVAGSGDDALAVFQRDPASGSLSFLQALVDGAQGVDGLDLASDLALSPDGAYLYVAGFGDEAVAVFSRSAIDGSLTYLSNFSGGLLDGVQSIEVAPDGANIYAAAQLDDALVVFSRDQSDGSIQYRGALRHNVNGADGLNGAHDLVISPDSRHIYTAGEFSNALSVALRNRAPAAQADGPFVVVINTQQEIAVLANDGDPDAGQNLIVSSVTNASLGSTLISGGGTTITYTAGAQAGADSFSYTVDDGFGSSSTATVSITTVLPKQAAQTANGQSTAGLQLSISPNPARKLLHCRLYLPQEGRYRLSLLDAHGREMAEVSRAVYNAGVHQLEVPAKTAAGADVTAGLYYLVLHAEEAAQTVHAPVLILR